MQADNLNNRKKKKQYFEIHTVQENECKYCMSWITELILEEEPYFGGNLASLMLCQCYLLYFFKEKYLKNMMQPHFNCMLKQTSPRKHYW